MITAALSWFDESPADLAACVIGAANVADKIMAVDGRWRRWPGTADTSPPEQAEVIRGTAAALGLECEVIVPDHPWAGQVEKRTWLMRWAVAGSDWVFVLDTDHIVYADRAAVRAEIEALPDSVDAVGATFVTTANEARALAQSAATNWHAGMAGGRQQFCVLFRALPDFGVDRFHWQYSATKNGVPISLTYGVHGITGATLRTPFVIEHRTLFRDEAHILANRAFCNDRIKVIALTGQEDDRPDVPEPGSPGWEYDFVTVPY